MIMAMKNTIENTGKRARELLVFSAVPQPTASPSAQQLLVSDLYLELPDTDIKI